MATRTAPSSLAQLPANRAELARRWELAREPVPLVGSRPPLRHLLGELVHLTEPVRRPFRRIAVAPAAEPRTVMLLPGFATHPIRMRYMARQLERAGHKVKRWGLGFNFGPSEANFDYLEDRLVEVYERYGRPVVLVGWSLGGLFARELAKRRPGMVLKVVTMGTPFSGDPRANNAWRIYQFVAGHRVDEPPVAAEINAKPPVETVALWSPRDGIVSPRSSCGRAGERDRAIALRCTHIGFSYSPESIATILAELESA
jgi:pimeloyl-ACP methyl ester carboxylesterase